MSINPKSLTNTRIPNTIFPMGSNYTNGHNRDFYCLRRVNGENRVDYLGSGIKKKFYQYDKRRVYNGLTPGDNGYLNDGGDWSVASDATSRFYLGSPFEWWDDYVIYCYDPHDGNPDSGYDDVEIYTANNLSSLISISEKLTTVTGTMSYIMPNVPGLTVSYSPQIGGGYSILENYGHSGKFTDNHYLRTDYIPQFNLSAGSGDYYTAIDFYAFDFNNPMTLISKKEDGNHCDFEITIESSTSVSYNINGDTVTYNVATMSANSWYNLFIKTYVANFGGGSQPSLSIYDYSSIVNIISTTGSIVNPITSNAFDLTIGCSSWNNPSKFFNGYLENFYFSGNSGGSAISLLNFEDFSSDFKYFTDQTGKVFTVYPEPYEVITEYDCLSALTKQEFLCVNTNYPDISPRPNERIYWEVDEFVSNLVLLIDFGFIPSYPRGGSYSYDISGNINHTMNLVDSSGGSYSYIGASMSNSGGGSLQLFGNSYGTVGISPDLNTTEGTISIWVRLNVISTGYPQDIVNNYDPGNKSGYKIIEQYGKFSFLYGDGYNDNNLQSNFDLSIDTWYNVVCVFNPGAVAIYVSDATNFQISGDGAVIEFPIVSNTTTQFQIGKGFDGQISLVSFYNIEMGKQIYDLWSAYTGTYPNRYFLDQSALFLTFDDITSADALVVDSTDVNKWNLFFDLPTNGNEFISVYINGNTVKLVGGGIHLRDEIFTSTPLISIVDNGCILTAGFASLRNCPQLTDIILPQLTSAGDECFNGCTSMITFNLPQLTTAGLNCFIGCSSATTFNLPLVENIGDQCFDGCSSATTFNLPVCINLGTTVGYNAVFHGVSLNTITLTIPTALTTCNGGGFDEDIESLNSNNTLTIITV